MEEMHEVRQGVEDEASCPGTSLPESSCVHQPISAPDAVLLRFYGDFIMSHDWLNCGPLVIDGAPLFSREIGVGLKVPTLSSHDRFSWQPGPLSLGYRGAFHKLPH